jgi:hypothetical protein
MGIEAFEHAASPSAQLVAVSGLVDRTGRLASASPWYYTYRDPPDATSTVYQWRVDAAGVVTHAYFGNCGFFYSAESADRLSVDSDKLWRPRFKPVATHSSSGIRSVNRPSALHTSKERWL